MVLFLVLVPLALVAVAAALALISVGRSSLRITADGVEIRNHRQPARLVPLDQVAHFEAPAPVGSFASLRPPTAVLVLTDGSRLTVRRPSDPEAGTGIDALNARVAALRR